jgi:hypothetical protein
MDKKIRRMLGGMSTASLVLAGSIPLMAQTGSTDKSPKAVKEMSKGDLKDTKGKGGCGATRTADVKNKKPVKDTAGKGDCGKGKTGAPQRKSQ